MDAGCALKYMSEKYEDNNEYGQAHLLSLMSKDIMAVAERLDEEAWGPPGSTSLAPVAQ